MTSQTLVLGFDGSDASVCALHWAINTAERTHQRLHVVVVALEDDLLPAVLREHEARFAESTASQARDTLANSPVEGDVVIRRGVDVSLVLLEAARGGEPVIVGSRGHGFIESQWLGSVSQHVVTHALGSVVVARPQRKPEATQILVGIDGSPGTAAALRFAAERATLIGVPVLAVHAYQFPGFSVGGALGVLPSDIDMTMTETAERMAAELVAGVLEDYPDIQIRHTATLGRAGEVLTRLSEDAALVVVGARGRNSVEQLLLGSVAHELVHRASCTVAVVR